MSNWFTRMFSNNDTKRREKRHERRKIAKYVGKKIGDKLGIPIHFSDGSSLDSSASLNTLNRHLKNTRITMQTDPKRRSRHRHHHRSRRHHRHQSSYSSESESEGTAAAMTELLRLDPRDVEKFNLIFKGIAAHPPAIHAAVKPPTPVESAVFSTAMAAASPPQQQQIVYVEKQMAAIHQQTVQLGGLSSERKAAEEVHAKLIQDLQQKLAAKTITEAEVKQLLAASNANLTRLQLREAGIAENIGTNLAGVQKVAETIPDKGFFNKIWTGVKSYKKVIGIGLAVGATVALAPLVLPSGAITTAGVAAMGAGKYALGAGANALTRGAAHMTLAPGDKDIYTRYGEGLNAGLTGLTGAVTWENAGNAMRYADTAARMAPVGMAAYGAYQSMQGPAPTGFAGAPVYTAPTGFAGAPVYTAPTGFAGAPVYAPGRAPARTLAYAPGTNAASAALKQEQYGNLAGRGFHQTADGSWVNRAGTTVYVGEDGNIYDRGTNAPVTMGAPGYGGSKSRRRR